MIVRSSKFLLTFLAATLLGMAVLAVVAVWQLSRGPVSLGFLTPYVEDSLSNGADGMQVRLHDTVLAWAGLEHTLEVRAVGLEIVDSDGKVGASVPELLVQFSLRALMRGLIAPIGLELFSPRLRVVRMRDGEVVVGIGGVTAGGQTVGDGVGIVGGLLREPNPDTPTGYLRRVSIVSGLIEFEDRLTGRNWTTQRADIALERDDDGIRADGTIVLDTGKNLARFEISGLLNRISEAIELDISFDKLSPVAVAALDPRLSQLDRFKLPVSGTLSLSLAASLAVEDVNFDLTSGTGEIVMPEVYPNPLPVTQFALRGHATEAFNNVVIDAAVVDVGGPVVTLSGELERREKFVEFQIETNAKALPIDDLDRLWPPEAAVNARKWITTNIKDGVVNSAALSMSATANLDDIEAVDVRKATGEINLRDATVHYLLSMPPVRNVAGVGRFDGVNFVFDISEGNVGKLNIEAVRAAINGLTGPAPVATVRVEATLAGPVRDTLALLDQKPFNSILSLGLDPATTRGSHITNTVVEFPLLDTLDVKDVEVEASVRLKDYSALAVAFGSDITQGNFDISVDKKKLVAKGDGTVAGIPLKLTWTKNFTDETALRTRYQVQAILDDDDRKNLGLAANPYLTGPIGVGLIYEIAVDGAAQGAANLNLANATMSLSEFGWQKLPGRIAAARVEFASWDGVLSEISKFAINAPELTVNGSATLIGGDNELKVSVLNLERIVLGETDVSLRAVFRDDGVPDIVIGGNKLDLRLLVKDVFANGNGGLPAMRVRFNTADPVRSIQLGDETVLLHPTGWLAHDGEDWAAIDLLGKLSNGGKVDLQLQAVNGQREVLFVSDDGGGVLRALDWINTVEDGTLQLKGTFTNSGGNEAISGQLSMEGFKLNKNSATVRVLSLASLSGISDAVAGTGITMRRAEVPFEVTDGEIRIGDAKARGAGAGIIATGRIDRTSNEIDIRGEIAPAYLINSLLSNIPLVGGIIGDGIIAVTYVVKGPLDDPSVSVNPLTVFVPGIFRKAFTGFGNGEGVVEGSTEQSAPAPGE